MLDLPYQTISWYLNSRATHRVLGNPLDFTSIHPANGARVHLTGAQNHDVIGVGNVDIQVLFGAIKSISYGFNTPCMTNFY